MLQIKKEIKMEHVCTTLHMWVQKEIPCLLEKIFVLKQSLNKIHNFTLTFNPCATQPTHLGTLIRYNHFTNSAYKTPMIGKCHTTP